MDEETQYKIRELQNLEQGMNNLVMQKEAFQAEFSETDNALSEISQSHEEIFKLVGNIMVKTEKKKVEEELTKKKKLLEIRLKAIDSEEQSITKQAEELKKEVMEKIQK